MLLEDANVYLDNRLFNDSWINANDIKKQSALDLSEDIIKGEYGEGIVYHSNYNKAVYEQSLYLLDNENNTRFKLQIQNVKSVSIDDTAESFSGKDILISPYVRKHLKKPKVINI